MTTIVAVKKNGIAAIAADTLTTFGNTRLPSSPDASHDKILHIGNRRQRGSSSGAGKFAGQNTERAA